MHMAFTLTQKRRARDMTATRYNKLVDAVEKVWPRNTGSLAVLIRRTLARTGIIGSLASRFVIPVKTKHQKRARKSVKRMQGFGKDLLRKVNDPTDTMDLEHAVQELCGTNTPVKQQSSSACEAPAITNTDAPPSHTRPNDASSPLGDATPRRGERINVTQSPSHRRSPSKCRQAQLLSRKPFGSVVAKSPKALHRDQGTASTL
ncbi:hypothetical protein Neosp_006849 [[Neocosmospora] mangrovei]